MATTVKVSEATRDRIRAYGGATHEETIIAALDALDAQSFWAQAERAATALAADPTARRRIGDEAASWDRAVGSLE
jgi:hypothetical protein